MNVDTEGFRERGGDVDGRDRDDRTPTPRSTGKERTEQQAGRAIYFFLGSCSVL